MSGLKTSGENYRGGGYLFGPQAPTVSEHYGFWLSVHYSKGNALDFLVTLCSSHDLKEISLKCVAIIVLALFEICGLAVVLLKI